MPPLRAAAFRFDANFAESRSAGGVGSGSGELSQTVAALCGPSISGFCAGLVFGNRTARRCSVRTRARLAAVCFGVCAAELPRAGLLAALEEELEPVTCEKPWSEAAAAASGATAVGSGAAAAESAGADRS